MNGMRTVLVPLLYNVIATFRSRAALQLEVLALRQQLAVLQHTGPRRPRLRPADRVFWVSLQRTPSVPESINVSGHASVACGGSEWLWVVFIPSGFKIKHLARLPA